MDLLLIFLSRKVKIISAETLFYFSGRFSVLPFTVQLCMVLFDVIIRIGWSAACEGVYFTSSYVDYSAKMRISQ